MPNSIHTMETWLKRFIATSDESNLLVISLWTIGTYLWPQLDTFPYLVITSETKRSGKTRLSELISFASRNPRNIAGATAAAIYVMIRDSAPTLFIDEAETLASESANTMRAVLNAGFRRGQTIPRVVKGEVEDWPAYCPKVFILIGDVYDTLRDRSIIVRMIRGNAPERFQYETVKTEGQVIGKEMANVAADQQQAILDAYATQPVLAFVSDRDADIWAPLFAIASVIVPDRMAELTRVAVDLATEKTAPIRRVTTLGDAEERATDDEFAHRLLVDMVSLLGKDNKQVFTADAIAALKAIPEAPWRRFRGTGLSDELLANMLSRFDVQPVLINARKLKRVARGYRRAALEEALKRNP